MIVYYHKSNTKSILPLIKMASRINTVSEINKSDLKIIPSLRFNFD